MKHLREYIRQILIEAEEVDAQIPSAAPSDWSAKSGKDVDFPAGNKAGVLFFSEDDLEYSVGGQTHGALSHAIKHMKDIFATVPDIGSKMDSLAGKFKAEVINHIKDGGSVWSSDGGEPQALQDEESLNAVLDKNLVNLFRNTIDRINDKVENGEKLSSVEQKLASLVEPLEDAYKSRAKAAVRKADQCKEKDKKKVCMRRNRVTVLYDDEVVSSWGIVNKKKKPKASLYPKADPEQQEKIINKVLGT